jgi:hypothetical protein
MGNQSRNAELGRMPRASSAPTRYSPGWFLVLLAEARAVVKREPSAMVQAMIGE